MLKRLDRRAWVALLGSLAVALVIGGLVASAALGPRGSAPAATPTRTVRPTNSISPVATRAAHTSSASSTQKATAITVPAAPTRAPETATKAVSTRTDTPSRPPSSTRLPTRVQVPSATGTPAPIRTRTPSSTPRLLPPTNTATRVPTAPRSPATFTHSPVPPPPASGGAHIGSCAVFPSDNIWNRKISALPKHPLSDTYIRTIGLDAPLHTAFGSGLYQGAPLGMPFVLVPGSQPRIAMDFTYSAESEPGPYPIPPDAPIEGGPDSDGDRHVAVIDTGSCVLYELYHAWPQPDGSWHAGSGARWDLKSNSLRPDGWTSADAAGLPLVPALVRYDEVMSGEIRHALRFTVPSTQKAHIWPARHDAGESHDPDLPPMGLRVRLKAGVSISGYPTEVRVILQALKDYGMFLADNGDPPWNIDGTPDERWNNRTLKMLENIKGSDLEAVDESGLMVDPNSGQSR